VYAKNEALRARLAHEQQMNEERNRRKAAEATEKIMKASRLRHLGSEDEGEVWGVKVRLKVQVRTRVKVRAWAEVGVRMRGEGEAEVEGEGEA